MSQPPHVCKMLCANFCNSVQKLVGSPRRWLYSELLSQRSAQVYHNMYYFQSLFDSHLAILDCISLLGTMLSTKHALHYNSLHVRTLYFRVSLISLKR